MEEWCKHCDEYKIEKELTLNVDEVKTIVNLMDCEWIRYLEEEEENLLKKMKKYLKEIKEN